MWTDSSLVKNKTKMKYYPLGTYTYFTRKLYSHYVQLSFKKTEMYNEWRTADTKQNRWNKNAITLRIIQWNGEVGMLDEAKLHTNTSWESKFKFFKDIMTCWLIFYLFRQDTISDLPLKFVLIGLHSKIQAPSFKINSMLSRTFSLWCQHYLI